MSSATIHDFPQVDPINARITKTIRTLMADREMDAHDVLTRTGLKRGTFYNRLRGRGDWTAPELQRVADVLGVDVATLFSGLKLPHLDSNQKPAEITRSAESLCTDPRRDEVSDIALYREFRAREYRSGLQDRTLSA